MTKMKVCIEVCSITTTANWDKSLPSWKSHFADYSRSQKSCRRAEYVGPAGPVNYTLYSNYQKGQGLEKVSQELTLLGQVPSDIVH